jgi:hypothetical protein
MARHSLEGARVRLIRDIETKGGVKFKKGLTMRVTCVEVGGRGGKIAVGCFKRGWYKSVHRISRDDFDVIEYAKDKEED